MRSEDSRALVTGALALASLILVVLGTWGTAGWLAWVPLGLGLFLNLCSSATAPFIPPYGLSFPGFCILGVVVSGVALIAGTIAFGWWGLAYAATAFVVYMLACAVANR